MTVAGTRDVVMGVWSSSIPQHRGHRHADFGGAAEEGQVDEEGGGVDRGAQAGDEADGGVGGAARGQDVVDDQDAVGGGQGVVVDFEDVLAVFETVGLAEGPPGELARPTGISTQNRAAMPKISEAMGRCLANWPII